MIILNRSYCSRNNSNLREGWNNFMFPHPHCGGKDPGADLGHIVLEHSGDFFEQSMLPETAYGSGYPRPLSAREERPQPPRRHPADEMLRAQDGKDKLDILLEEEVDAAVLASAGILHLACDFAELLPASGIIFETGDEGHIPPVRVFQQFPDDTETVDGLLYRGVLHAGAASPVFHLPAVFEKRDVVCRCLNAQYIVYFYFLDGAHSDGLVERSEILLAPEDDVGSIFDLHDAPMPSGREEVVHRVKSRSAPNAVTRLTFF